MLLAPLNFCLFKESCINLLDPWITLKLVNLNSVVMNFCFIVVDLSQVTGYLSLKRSDLGNINFDLLLICKSYFVDFKLKSFVLLGQKCNFSLNFRWNFSLNGSVLYLFDVGFSIDEMLPELFVWGIQSIHLLK
jgi:hypothetical protein